MKKQRKSNSKLSLKNNRRKSITSDSSQQRTSSSTSTNPSRTSTTEFALNTNNAGENMTTSGGNGTEKSKKLERWLSIDSNEGDPSSQSRTTNRTTINQDDHIHIQNKETQACTNSSFYDSSKIVDNLDFLRPGEISNVNSPNKRNDLENRVSKLPTSNIEEEKIGVKRDEIDGHDNKQINPPPLNHPATSTRTTDYRHNSRNEDKQKPTNTTSTPKKKNKLQALSSATARKRRKEKATQAHDGVNDTYNPERRYGQKSSLSLDHVSNATSPTAIDIQHHKYKEDHGLENDNNPKYNAHRNGLTSSPNPSRSVSNQEHFVEQEMINDNNQYQKKIFKLEVPLLKPTADDDETNNEDKITDENHSSDKKLPSPGCNTTISTNSINIHHEDHHNEKQDNNDSTLAYSTVKTDRNGSSSKDNQDNSILLDKDVTKWNDHVQENDCEQKSPMPTEYPASTISTTTTTDSHNRHEEDDHRGNDNNLKHYSIALHENVEQPSSESSYCDADSEEEEAEGDSDSEEEEDYDLDDETLSQFTQEMTDEIKHNDDNEDTRNIFIEEDFTQDNNDEEVSSDEDGNDALVVKKVSFAAKIIRIGDSKNHAQDKSMSQVDDEKEILNRKPQIKYREIKKRIYTPPFGGKTYMRNEFWVNEHKFPLDDVIYRIIGFYDSPETLRDYAKCQVFVLLSRTRLFDSLDKEEGEKMMKGYSKVYIPLCYSKHIRLKDLTHKLEFKPKIFFEKQKLFYGSSRTDHDNNNKKEEGMSSGLDIYFVHKSKETSERKLKRNECPNVFELFAGCGGMSEGFKCCEIGHRKFNIMWALDNNSDAAATYYKHNQSAKLFEECISDFMKIMEQIDNGSCHYDYYRFDGKDDKVLKVHHIHASPPCQGYSGANRKTKDKKEGKKRGGKNDKKNNDRTLEVLDVVKRFKPWTLSIENVTGMCQTENMHYLQKLILGLIQMKYQVRFMILNSADYGDPQKRKRVFVVGSKFGMPLPPAPKKTHGPDSDDKRPYFSAEEKLSVVKDLKPCPTKGGVLNLNEKIIRDHTVWGTGINKENYPIRHGEPSMTVRTGNCIVHPTLNRALTVREYALIQSFPLDFRFFGSAQSKRKQIGNAVPVKMAAAVAMAILESCYNCDDEDESLEESQESSTLSDVNA